jgi:hypothetical protein
MEFHEEVTMKNKIIFLSSSICVIAFFIVIIFSLAGPTQAGRQPSAGDDPNSKLIDLLQQELTKSDLSTEGRKDIEQRIGLLNEQAPQKAPVNVPQDDYYKIPDGIEANPIPPRQSDLVISNAWRKTVKDHLYHIYAGHLTIDPKQGAIMIFTSDPYSFVIYRTPELAGSISIVSEKDMLIELKSEMGELYYFDVIQEAFIVDGKIVKVDPGTGENRNFETPYPAP